MMRCTLYVCGSRRSSDGDVQPSQLVPSRERRHHINLCHIVIGVYRLATRSSLRSNSFQVSSPASVEPCRVSSVSMSFFWHARVWSRRMSFIMPRSHDFFSSAWSRSLGAAAVLPFVVGHPFLKGCFCPRRANPPRHCVPRVQLSRSCSVPFGVCVP